jgi:hypothetical protein
MLNFCDALKFNLLYFLWFVSWGFFSLFSYFWLVQFLLHYCSLFLCYHSIVIWLLFSSSCCWLTPFALLIDFFYILDKFFLYCCSFLLHCYSTFLVLFSCYSLFLLQLAPFVVLVNSSYYYYYFVVLVGSLLCWFDSFYCWSTPLVNVGWFLLLLVLLVGFSCSTIQFLLLLCWSIYLIVGLFFLLLVGFFFSYCLSPLIVLIDSSCRCSILLLWWSAILLLLFNFYYCCFVLPSLNTFLT